MSKPFNSTLSYRFNTVFRSTSGSIRSAGAASTLLARHPDLLDEIKKQSYAFGGGHDDLSRLCEWIVDLDQDDPDSWTNIRPY